MATGGQIGSGIKAGYSTNSGSTWTTITQILEGDPPQSERDQVETTVHGVTSTRSKIPGLSDISDARVLLLADFDRVTSPSHLGLSDLETSQDTVLFRYEIPISSNLASTNYFVYQFNARVGSFKPSTPIDDKKTIEVTFQYAGGTFSKLENQATALS